MSKPLVEPHFGANFVALEKDNTIASLSKAHYGPRPGEPMVTVNAAGQAIQVPRSSLFQNRYANAEDAFSLATWRRLFGELTHPAHERTSPPIVCREGEGLLDALWRSYLEDGRG